MKKMDKSSKEKIKELKKEGKYEDIFRQYGSKAYKKYVPLKYKREDKKKLKKEGKYEDIYNKYGQSAYDKILVKAMYGEIKQEKGVMQAALWRVEQRMRKTLKRFGLASSVFFLASTYMLSLNTESEITENGIIHESEIEDYNEKISDYANEVNSMKLTDLQVFMKVMDDMWSNIKGYATPEKDIAGYRELDLANPEGYGVCRNMASDVAKKLKEINPKYNARTLHVEVGRNGNYEFADIKRNVIETNETVVDEKENTPVEDMLDEGIIGIVGNHMVTLVDIPKENLTLVLDPTNPGIGIYYEGKITMFNSGKENALEYSAKEYSTAVFSKGGSDWIRDTAEDYLKSYKKPTLSFEELYEKYGLEAQNKALNEVRARSLADESLKDIDKPNSFREKLKFTSTNVAKNLSNKNTERTNAIRENER